MKDAPRWRLLLYKVRMILTGRARDGLLWVRLFGAGFFVKNTETFPLTFSERKGLHKLLRFGRWAIGYLPRYKY